MKYESGKHLEYAKWLVVQNRGIQDICDDIVGKWVIDENLDDALATEDTLELEVFNRALQCAGREYEDERDEIFQEILDLLKKA